MARIIIVPNVCLLALSAATTTRALYVPSTKAARFLWPRTAITMKSTISTRQQKRMMMTSVVGSSETTEHNDDTAKNKDDDDENETPIIDKDYKNNKDERSKSVVKITHLNHAGASPSPDTVYERVIQHMKLEQDLGGYAAANQVQEEIDNVYTSLGELLHTPNYKKEIALVESATVGWTRLFYSMIQYKDLEEKYEKDEDDISQTTQNKHKKYILVSEAEYAANIVAICQWCKETHHQYDWNVISLPSTTTDGITTMESSTGIVNVTILQEMLNGQYVLDETTNEILNPSDIGLVCVTHVPTNSGIINPVYDIGELISYYNTEALLSKIDKAAAAASTSTTNFDNNNDGGTTNASPTVVTTMPSILYLVDACQSVGQMEVNVEEMGCHGLTGTGRKYLRGPRGTGFLYVNYDVAQHLTPNHVDHACAPVMKVPTVDEYTQKKNNVENLISIGYQDGAKRFEFWESNIANKLGLGEAVRHAMSIGLENIDTQCSSLSNKLRQRLRSMKNKNIHVHHDNIIQCSCGIVTFHVDGIPSRVIKERLWSSKDRCLFIEDDDCTRQFDVSLVPATSTPLDSAVTNVPDLVRISFSYTNTMDDIESLCHALDAIIIDEMNIFEEDEDEEEKR